MVLLLTLSTERSAPSIEVRKETGECHVSSNLGWDITVLSCCVATLTTYVVSAIRARCIGAPGVVHNRELWRAWCYIANFVVSFGAEAVQDLGYREDDGYNTFSVIAWFMLCLNGAVNVLTYASQTRSSLRNQAARDLSFHVAFSEGSSISDDDSFGYFAVHGASLRSPLAIAGQGSPELSEPPSVHNIDISLQAVKNTDHVA